VGEETHNAIPNRRAIPAKVDLLAILETCLDSGPLFIEQGNKGPLPYIRPETALSPSPTDEPTPAVLALMVHPCTTATICLQLLHTIDQQK